MSESKIINLLVVASLSSRSTSMIDRLSNAMNSQVTIKSIYDAARILESLMRRGEGIEIKENKIMVSVKEDEEEKRYEVYGELPSSRDIDEFIEKVYEDPSRARDLAAKAIVKIVEVRMGVT